MPLGGLSGPVQVPGATRAKKVEKFPEHPGAVVRCPVKPTGAASGRCVPACHSPFPPKSDAEDLPVRQAAFLQARKYLLQGVQAFDMYLMAYLLQAFDITAHRNEFRKKQAGDFSAMLQ